jgi:hypothetical protein
MSLRQVRRSSWNAIGGWAGLLSIIFVAVLFGIELWPTASKEDARQATTADAPEPKLLFLVSTTAGYPQTVIDQIARDPTTCGLDGAQFTRVSNDLILGAVDHSMSPDEQGAASRCLRSIPGTTTVQAKP